MIEIAPADIKPASAHKILKKLNKFDLIILTSRYAVKHFFEWSQHEKISLEKLTSVDFACIGEETAEYLRHFGFGAKIVSDVETSEGLLERLEKEISLKNKKILFPRSSLPNPFLKEELQKRGAAVTELTIYQNTAPAKRELPKENIDKIVFTSPSTVENFLRNYGKIPGRWQILSKGPRTSQALKEAGYQSEIIILE